eukprot:1474161-Pyramimonas_sp.AAC.1
MAFTTLLIACTTPLVACTTPLMACTTPFEGLGWVTLQAKQLLCVAARAHGRSEVVVTDAFLLKV